MEWKSNMEPIICFGQQPSGFFPKRFLFAKIQTAKKLQKEIGGKIIYFYHDSDADYRETVTLMKDRFTGAEVRLNFTQENKIQKKFSPLYLKRIPNDWKNETLKQLPRFVDKPLLELFDSVNEKTAGDFCLKMYEKLGLFEGIQIAQSSNSQFREKAADLHTDFFADMEYEGEIVRAQLLNNKLMLHEGGGKYLEVPEQKVEKVQKSPGRDQRFAWMQSVLNCTHYIYGEGEKDYLNFKEFPEVTFLEREKIDLSNFAWLPNN